MLPSLSAVQHPKPTKPIYTFSPPCCIDCSIISTRRRMLAWTAAVPACLCCPPALAALATPPLAIAHPPWGYVGADGPEHWPGVCTTGTSQSPIDIASPIHNSAAAQSRFGTLRPRYPRVPKTLPVVTNNGHGSPQVNYSSECELDAGGRTYCLVQFHFHAPSEHKINGQHSLIEAHLVHKDVETGALAVVAVMFKLGRPNGAFKAALAAAPLYGDAAVRLGRSVSPLELLPPPNALQYATYEGSLTTPPCTEKVRWFVMLEAVEVGASQVLDFLAFGTPGGRLELNGRPEQALNGRQVEYWL